MNIEDTVALVTGAASAVGRAVSLELARRNVHGLALVDHDPSLARFTQTINQQAGDWICVSFCGDVKDPEFRKAVFEQTREACGTINVCVPICRLSNTPEETESELIGPVLWAHELVAALAASRRRQEVASISQEGMVVFTTSSTFMNHPPPEISASVRSRINSATVSLLIEAEQHGIGCAAVLRDNSPAGILLERLVPARFVDQETTPEAIAEAICFMIANAPSRKVTSPSHS